MSLWKFGNFEVEIDFTDADFLERLDVAQKELEEGSKSIPKVGKNADIIRAQCACFGQFFDQLFGEGSSAEMFGGKKSLDLHFKAVEMFAAFGQQEDRRIGKRYSRYEVKKKGNR